MTRELSKLGGVPNGSASSAILLPAGSKISNKDAAVPRKPMSSRISLKPPAIVFAELIRLTRIRWIIFHLIRETVPPPRRRLPVQRAANN